MKSIQMSRFALLIAMAVSMVLGGVMATLNGGIPGAYAAEAAVEHPGDVGTYEFTIAVNPEDELLEAFLVDTRTGEVFRGDYDSMEKAILWRKYVSPKFRH
jgi:hypothetical protein